MSLRRPAPLTLARAVLLLGPCVAVGVFLAGLTGFGDYRVNSLPGADNAGPPLQAIVHGHLDHLLSVQPVMGLVSLLWRAPFVAVANAVGGGDRVIYAAGAGACLLAAAALVLWLLLKARSTSQVFIAATAGVIILLGPATTAALSFGHPEEILTTVLAVAAVLAARADRRMIAAVLLGLAVGSKQWALLCTPAVLLALPGGRLRAACVGTGVAAVMCLPLPLLDLAAFHRADATIGGPIRIVDPWSLWFPLSPAHPASALDRVLPLGLRRTDAAFAFMGIAFAGLALVWGTRRSRGLTTRIDPLALLALIGLLRCLTDPFDAGYYLVAAIIPLAVWEVVWLRRLPLVAVLSCGVLAYCVPSPALAALANTQLSIPLRGTVFLIAGLMLCVYLTVRVFRAAPVQIGAPVTTSPRPSVQSPIGLLDLRS